MFAHVHRELSDALWITIERPTTHMLPLLPAVASYRIESVVSVYVAMSNDAPRVPCLPDKSPTSHEAPTQSA